MQPIHAYRIAARARAEGVVVTSEIAAALPPSDRFEVGQAFAPGSREALLVAMRLVEHADRSANANVGAAMQALRSSALTAKPRFPFNYTTDAVLNDAATARAFVLDYIDHEKPFFHLARCHLSGLAFDGVDLDPKTREVIGPRRTTAPSKECLDLAVLVKVLEGDALAQRFCSPKEAIAILERKLGTYERFDMHYPGYGGFMPWVYVDDEGEVAPADEVWMNRLPSLDNGEWLFAQLAVERSLRKAGETALADRYAQRLDKLRHSARTVFFDEEQCAVRGETIISNVRDPNATYTTGGIVKGTHGVHEGVMSLYFVSLYAKPPLSDEQVTRIWNMTRMDRVEAKNGTTWQGFWGSSHEEWEYAIMPKRDHGGYDQLFNIRQEIRTHDAVERGRPGLNASINSPAAGPQNQPNPPPYAADHGIPSIALENVTDYPFYAVYGVFPVLLAQADSAKGREGLAWLLNGLRAPNAVTSIGGGESVSSDGTAAAPMKTVDGSFLNWLGLMGGLAPEMRERLKDDGVYDTFMKLIAHEYNETFGKAALRDPAGMAAPQVHVPWSSQTA